jgi:beta-lactamase superfamily II metal-dependent hydrolase
MPFWDNVIDVMVLTDTDDEHLAGAVAALERYNVRQIIQIDANAKSAAYQKWRDLIVEKNVPSVSVQADLQIHLDHAVTLEMLTPPFVRLRAGGATFLFADSWRADDGLPADAPSTVLIAPLKVNTEFIDAVSPQFVVMFTGASERTQPPPASLDALANTPLLRTDERGTIEMIVDGSSLIVR